MTGPQPDHPPRYQPPYTPPPPFVRPADPNPTPPPYPYGYGYPSPHPYGYGYPPPRPPRPPDQLALGIVAAAVAGLGTLLVLVALVALPWFSVGGGLTTGDVRGVLDAKGEVANDLSVAYFSWLSWTLLVLAAGCAALAVLPRPGLSLAFRIAGPLVAGFAALFTVGAMELVDSIYDDENFYFHHLGAAFWVTLVGFACLGAGAIVGPRRVPTPPGTGPQPATGATFQP